MANESSNENSEADITATFSGDCTDVDVESTKDISFVSVNYEDPPAYTYETFDGLSGHQFSHEGDTSIRSIVVKSGTTREVFNCPDGGGEVDPDPDEEPECSDGVDNDGDELVDHPVDPGCQTPDDDDERNAEDPDPCKDAGGDSDGDGVCDDDDECPDKKGPANNKGCPDDGGPMNLCMAKADDPGLLTEDTLGQTLWDAGLDALSPLTEDPERNGLISGPLGEAGTGTPIEVVTDEASCALDLLLDEEVFPVDP